MAGKKISALKGKKTTKASAAEAASVRGGARKLKVTSNLIQKRTHKLRRSMKE